MDREGNLDLALTVSSDVDMETLTGVVNLRTQSVIPAGGGQMSSRSARVLGRTLLRAARDAERAAKRERKRGHRAHRA